MPFWCLKGLQTFKSVTAARVTGISLFSPLPRKMLGQVRLLLILYYQCSYPALKSVTDVRASKAKEKRCCKKTLLLPGAALPFVQAARWNTRRGSRRLALSGLLRCFAVGFLSTRVVFSAFSHGVESYLELLT